MKGKKEEMENRKKTKEVKQKEIGRKIKRGIWKQRNEKRKRKMKIEKKIKEKDRKNNGMKTKQKI